MWDWVEDDTMLTQWAKWPNFAPMSFVLLLALSLLHHCFILYSCLHEGKHINTFFTNLQPCHHFPQTMHSKVSQYINVPKAPAIYIIYLTRIWLPEYIISNLFGLQSICHCFTHVPTDLCPAVSIDNLLNYLLFQSFSCHLQTVICTYLIILNTALRSSNNLYLGECKPCWCNLIW